MRAHHASSYVPRASIATRPSRASAACRLSRRTRRLQSPLGRAARAPRRPHRPPVGRCGLPQAGARAGRGRGLVAPPWRPQQPTPNGRRRVLWSGAAGRTSQATPWTPPPPCTRAPGTKQAAVALGRRARRRWQWGGVTQRGARALVGRALSRAVQPSLATRPVRATLQARRARPRGTRRWQWGDVTQRGDRAWAGRALSRAGQPLLATRPTTTLPAIQALQRRRADLRQQHWGGAGRRGARALAARVLSHAAQPLLAPQAQLRPQGRTWAQTWAPTGRRAVTGQRLAHRSRNRTATSHLQGRGLRLRCGCARQAVRRVGTARWTVCGTAGASMRGFRRALRGPAARALRSNPI